ncbi:MAG: alkaline phosphatase family protein, partial [Armatimonadota bacterium]
RRADEFVGEVLSHAGEDTAVMILSDHGAGPLSGFVDPDALLHQLGYRSYRTPPIWERPLRPLIRNARKLYARLLKPHLSKRHQRRIRRGVPRTAGERKPDWTRSRAYAVGPYLCLRLNLQGREASGSVPAADRQRLRDELVAELNEVTNPFSGQRDLNVHPAEEYYSGEYTDLGPDIVALPQNFALETVHIAGNIDQPFLERKQIPPRFDGKRMLEGTHRMNGVLAVRTGRSDPRIADTPHLTDVAPTALALLSLPIPSGLDGGVVLDIPHTIAEGEAPTRTGPERQSSPGYSEDEARQVEQRLRDLGYM